MDKSLMLRKLALGIFKHMQSLTSNCPQKKYAIKHSVQWRISDSNKKAVQLDSKPIPVPHAHDMGSHPYNDALQQSLRTGILSPQTAATLDRRLTG